MNKNILIKIDDIVYPGKSMGRNQGKIIFTNIGLPHELVEVNITKTKKSYNEAKTIKVIETSPHRIEPKCEHYDVCSLYQYINYPFQLKLKHQQLKNMFTHALKLELPEITVKPSSSILAYRNKIRLTLRWYKNKPSFYYHTPNTQSEFTPINICYLVSEQMNNFLKDLLHTISDKKITFIHEVTLRENFQKKLLLILHLENQRKTLDLKGFLSNITTKYTNSSATCICGGYAQSSEIILWGINYLSEKIGSINYDIGPLSFFQINTPLIHTVIADIKKLIPLKGNEIIADLYCGIGTFGLNLANDAKMIFGVESETSNLSFLTKNISSNKIDNFTVYAGLSERWITKILSHNIDILIVDPPRKGLDSLICKKLIKNPPQTIIYLSCNPATLLRDLKVLSNYYTFKTITFYDFFPNTPHIETMVVLEKIQ